MQIGSGDANVQTGQTAREVIWTKNKARLYHYLPIAERRIPLPLLCIYALINRCYVLDLQPGNSLIEHLVKQGFEVYLLDWGVPGEEDSQLDFEQYIFDYIARAVKKVLGHAQATECSILGYCMGGTLSAMYAALFPTATLRNLLLLTTPIDFSAEYTGLYGTWLSKEHFTPELLVAAYHNIPGELITIGSHMLKAAHSGSARHTTMGSHSHQDRSQQTAHAIHKWVNDGIPFAGAAFQQWICDFYQQNKLVKGQISLRGQHVDLAHIACSLLSIAGKRDRICTPPQAEAIMHMSSSQDKEFIVLDAGHVGLLTGSHAKQELFPKLCTWLEARSHQGRQVSQ